MSARQRVAVAMSGGVDSATAAAWLLEQGYAVRGLTARFWRECESDADIVAARAVCDHLGIAHEVVDLRNDFYEVVVQRFVSEYARGRTPNPCIVCNRELKFGLLLALAVARGERLATGHYAQIASGPEGWRLLSAVDMTKDQSYFLYMLGQKQLAQVLFPLGAWRKADVIGWARSRGLPSADRMESQDVCFIADGDYRRFIRERAPELLQPGPMVDEQGRVLGEHRGLALYTVGQREGLGISAREPLYVLALDVARNALVVGPTSALGHQALLAEEVTFISGMAPQPTVALQAKIRYRARPASCRLTPLRRDRALIEFDAPLRDITPGQAVVMYNEDVVIGGGTIAHAVSVAEAEEIAATC